MPFALAERGQGFFVLPFRAVRTPRDPILRHVHDTLRRLLPNGGHVLVAVSGGRDSIVLADGVRRLARRLRLKVTIAHVHHGLRGAAADGDEAFVAATARAWGIRCVTTRVRTEAVRRRRRRGVEEAARAVRYRALDRLRRKVGADLILTAHHADDQAETVFLRATRGAHRRGLAGILPVLRQPPVARPLLTIPRTEIDQAVVRRRLRYRDDASNDDLSFRRNLIRHRLLDQVGRALRTEVGSALPRLASAALRLGAASEAMLVRLQRSSVRNQGRVHLFDDHDVRRWPVEVQNEVLARWLLGAGLEPTNARLDAARALLTRPVGRWRPVGGKGWRIYRERHGLSLVCLPPVLTRSTTLVRGKTTRFVGSHVHVGRPRTVPRSVKGPADRIWLDADALEGPLSVRCWKPSDRIIPLGMRSERKVSDLLTDRKVPAWRKRHVPVVLSGRRIVWVCGIAIDTRAKVHPGTKQVLQFSYQSNV